jgi:hypothetical protein
VTEKTRVGDTTCGVVTLEPPSSSSTAAEAAERADVDEVATRTTPVEAAAVVTSWDEGRANAT